MAETPRASAPIRTFGVQDSEGEQQQQNPPSALRRVLSRLSFSSSRRRPSFFGGDGNEAHSEQPPIPSMAPGEPDATPLPKLSMIVLSIVCVFVVLSPHRKLTSNEDNAWGISVSERIHPILALHGERLEQAVIRCGMKLTSS